MYMKDALTGVSFSVCALELPSFHTMYLQIANCGLQVTYCW